MVVGNYQPDESTSLGRRYEVYSSDGIIGTLTATDYKQPKVILQRGRGFNKGGIHNIAPTLSSDAWHQNNFTLHDSQIRRLTPRECWRLQGFPDWAFERARESGVSDSQLYKQAGNSVTVNVIYEIAKKLKTIGDCE